MKLTCLKTQEDRYEFSELGNLRWVYHDFIPSWLISWLMDCVQVMWPERWKVKMMRAKFMICKCLVCVRRCNPLEPFFVLFCVFAKRKEIGWNFECHRCQIYSTPTCTLLLVHWWLLLMSVHLIWARCWLIHPLKRCMLLLWVIRHLETIREMSSTTSWNYSWTKPLCVETNCGSWWCVLRSTWQ